MAILYTLVIHNPNRSTVDNWPTQILESSWYTELKKVTVDWTDAKSETKTTSTRVAYFSSVSAFETWMNANRLTDSTLVSVLNEWKSTYSITMEEQYSELPDYSPTVPGIFG
jgi:hypothetical protein